jgi:hypothetical protein
MTVAAKIPDEIPTRNVRYGFRAVTNLDFATSED